MICLNGSLSDSMPDGFGPMSRRLLKSEQVFPTREAKGNTMEKRLFERLGEICCLTLGGGGTG